MYFIIVIIKLHNVFQFICYNRSCTVYTIKLTLLSPSNSTALICNIFSVVDNVDSFDSLQYFPFPIKDESSYNPFLN